MMIFLGVALVGGTGAYEGYLYATNPVTKIYGPVCDDYFTISAVSWMSERAHWIKYSTFVTRAI